MYTWQCGNYTILIKELWQTFVSIRVQAIQSSLFNVSHQKRGESVDDSAQYLCLFYQRSYYHAQHANPAAKAMGKVSSGVSVCIWATLTVKADSEVAGKKGGLEHQLDKAKSEEAKSTWTWQSFQAQ